MGSTKLCMSCMTRVPADADFCPFCKYDGSQENDNYALPIGARVGERYVLGRSVDCDGETITYIGFDLVEKQRVLIKEYMPVHGSLRDTETGAVSPKSGAEIHFKTGLSDFTDLYSSLMAMSDSEGLIKTLDIVYKSNTAYVVMEFFAGVTFSNFVKRNDGRITAQKCTELLKPVFDALASMHNKNMLHCAIAPDNIKLNKDGQVKLGGFATVSTRTAGTEYEPKLNSGFTAPEQYNNNTFLTPASDVYALAATIYYAITGEVPPSADSRKIYDSLKSADEINPDVPAYVSRALNSAMVINPKERTQTLLELKAGLNNSIDYAEPAAPIKINAKPKKETPFSKLFENAGSVPRWIKTISIVAASTCVVMGIVFLSWQYVLFSRENKVEQGGPAVEEKAKVRNFVGEKADSLVLDGEYSYEISYVFSAQYSVGTVAEQSPTAGSEYENGKKVSIKVSKGPNTVVVPDLTYMEQRNAAAMLDKLGIQYTLEYKPYPGGIESTVFSQNIAAKSSVDASTARLILYVTKNS